jgi:methionyl-tRNA formyltransferase
MSPQSWRVVVFTNVPGGFVATTVAEVLGPLSHRAVGALTTPGPRRRRSTGYLDDVAAVPPGIEVIVSNYPARWAAMLSPLQPDRIMSAGIPWRIPPDVLEVPRLGAIANGTVSAFALSR